MVIAFLCNCGNDLIGTKKERTGSKYVPKSTSDVEIDSENESGPIVCDLDAPDVDLDLNFDNINISQNEEDREEIEHISKKAKVSEGEVIAILDDMDSMIHQDNVSVKIVTSEPVNASTAVPEAAASTSTATTSRSGRKVKKNPKYLE